TVRADFVQPAEIRVARPGDQQLDVTEFLGGTVHESLDRLRIGDIQRERYRLAAVGADLVDELLALLDAAGAQRNGKAMGGKLDGRRGADARRRTGHDGRPAFRMRLEPGHSGDLHANGQGREPAG